MLLALLMVCVAAALGVAPARSAVTHEFDAALSLRGDCEETTRDPIPDPGCPGGEHPPSGRFDSPNAVATDTYGNIYVVSGGPNEPNAEGRIDVFGPDGNFVTEVSAENAFSVAVDSKGVLYVYENPPLADAAVVRFVPTIQPAAGEVEYGSASEVVATPENARFSNQSGVTVDPATDHLFFLFGYAIREYSSYEEGNELIDEITGPEISYTTWGAVDGDRRRLYASSCRDEVLECVVLVFDADAPHELLAEIDGSNTPQGEFVSEKGWLSVAVEEESGHVFVDDLEKSRRIFEFDENYEYVSTILNPVPGGNALNIAISNADGAENLNTLFVPGLTAHHLFAFSHVIVATPPVVEAVTAAQIGQTEAALRAKVSPKGAATGYAFEYTTEQAFTEEGGFGGSATVVEEGTIPADGENAELSAHLSGLSPGVAYRFRVRLSNSAGNVEMEGSFSTYPPEPAPGGCQNQVLRNGYSAALPDCRAYELVTPADTNGRAVRGVRFGGNGFKTLQASASGDAVSFTTEGGTIPGLGGSGAFNGNPYLSSRSPNGWSTANAGPNGTESSLPAPGSTSPDQGYSFWTAFGVGSAVVNETSTFYVRYPDGHSELIGRGTLDNDLTAKGMLITAGGTHIVFESSRRLEGDAPSNGTPAVYDRTQDGMNHVVSLLPGGSAPTLPASYRGASPEGNAIAWVTEDVVNGPTLYLRLNNAETFEIGDNVDFAGVSAEGKRIFFVRGGDLYAFDTASEEEIAFTQTGDATVVNVAEDGTRAYFVSPSVLTEEANPTGSVATAGEQNLYLSEEGRIDFVATLTTRDVAGAFDPGSGRIMDGLGLWTVAQALGPGPRGTLSRDPSRLTADGAVIVFQSRANLLGREPGGFPQVYRYDSVGDRLHCISCIPTGVAEGGGASLQSVAPVQQSLPPFSFYGFVPNLSADGQRAFFESREALVAWDTDGVQDVYQWEEAGTGSCTRSGGCVDLISSGRSASDNYLFGHDQTGEDVFFVTGDILAPGDDDTPSIYDARAGGGFPVAASAPCVGEGCRPGATAPPALLVPESGARSKSGNIIPRTRCPRGKRRIVRRGKVSCVRKHAKRRSHTAGTKRGGSK